MPTSHLTVEMLGLQAYTIIAPESHAFMARHLHISFNPTRIYLSINNVVNISGNILGGKAIIINLNCKIGTI